MAKADAAKSEKTGKKSNEDITGATTVKNQTLVAKYRDPAEIRALLELTIDSCLAICGQDLSPEEQFIIQKLRDWEVKLENQLMHLYEANLDPIEFKDIVNQTLGAVIDSVFEQARTNGTITPNEQKLLDNIVAKLKLP